MELRCMKPWILVRWWWTQAQAGQKGRRAAGGAPPDLPWLVARVRTDLLTGERRGAELTLSL